MVQGALQVTAPAFQDLNWIAALEARLFLRPWRHEDFIASLRRGDLFLAAWVKALSVAAEKCGVGYVLAQGDTQFLHLGTFGIHPEFRGKGYGRQLLRVFLDKARQLAAKQVTLEVRSDNVAAIRLYESEGFKCVGKRRQYYLDPPADALILNYEL